MNDNQIVRQMKKIFKLYQFDISQCNFKIDKLVFMYILYSIDSKELKTWLEYFHKNYCYIMKWKRSGTDPGGETVL